MKLGTYCYLPLTEDSIRFVRYMRENDYVDGHQGSFSFIVPSSTDDEVSNEEIPFLLMAAVNTSGATYRNFPHMPSFKNVPHGVYNQASNRYGFWAFVSAIFFAAQANQTHMLYFEDDCRFSDRYWVTAMWNDFKIRRNFPRLSGYSALLYGSPVCWHAWSMGAGMSRVLQSYAAEVSRVTGVHMAFEGAHTGPNPPSFYPNGALAIYSVELLKDVFREPLELFRLYMNKSYNPKQFAEQAFPMADRFVAFDLAIGLFVMRNLRHLVPYILTPAIPIYSGCKDHQVTCAERIKMLSSGKSAVHHLKISEWPDFDKAK